MDKKLEEQIGRIVEEVWNRRAIGQISPETQVKPGGIFRPGTEVVRRLVTRKERGA